MGKISYNSWFRDPVTIPDLSTLDWVLLMSGGAYLPQPAATAVTPVNSWSGEGRQIGDTEGFKIHICVILGLQQELNKE